MFNHDWWLLAEWSCFALSDLACRLPLSCAWCMLLRGIQPARPAVPWVNSPFGEVYVVPRNLVQCGTMASCSPRVLWLGCLTLGNSCSRQHFCHCVPAPYAMFIRVPCEAAVEIIAVLLVTTGVGPQLIPWRHLKVGRKHPALRECSNNNASHEPCFFSKKTWDLRIRETDCDDWFTGLFFDNRRLG